MRVVRITRTACGGTATVTDVVEVQSDRHSFDEMTEAAYAALCRVQEGEPPKPPAKLLRTDPPVLDIRTKNF